MSPRPKKTRPCQCRFCGRAFKPTGRPMNELKHIPFALDELEALRLCDLEGLTQAEAGEQMGVSRGTVQRLVAAARKKTAQALCDGCALVFQETGDKREETEHRRR